jgi:tryptophan-rich sensory protein
MQTIFLVMWRFIFTKIQRTGGGYITVIAMMLAGLTPVRATVGIMDVVTVVQQQITVTGTVTDP